MAKPGKKKKVLFVLEIIVLLLFIGGLYVYGQISSRLDKIEQPELKKEKIVVNQEAPKMTGYKTYVLFGIDTRGEGSQYSAQNSDTMIIVSVNNDTKEVRMVSVYRDTLLNVGDDTYTKANAAYALGGPEQAITMLNTNLDLDISDYATADFSALVEVIDDLGGLDIPLSYAEIEHMNNYCVETSKLTGKDYTPIEKPEQKPEEKPAEKPDEQPTQLQVNVLIDASNGLAYEGGEIGFIAAVSGAEPDELLFQWQYSEDGENWEDIAGATGQTHEETVTPMNANGYWRVLVKKQAETQKGE